MRVSSPRRRRRLVSVRSSRKPKSRSTVRTSPVAAPATSSTRDPGGDRRGAVGERGRSSSGLLPDSRLRQKRSLSGSKPSTSPSVCVRPNKPGEDRQREVEQAGGEQPRHVHRIDRPALPPPRSRLRSALRCAGRGPARAAPRRAPAGSPAARPSSALPPDAPPVSKRTLAMPSSRAIGPCAMSTSWTRSNGIERWVRLKMPLSMRISLVADAELEVAPVEEGADQRDDDQADRRR